MSCLLMIAVVQILLESLPVSSSGHIRLLEQISLRSGWLCPSLSQSVEFMLHGPTIIVLAVYFFRSWWTMLVNFRRYHFVIINLMLRGFVAESATILLYILFSWVGTNWFPLPLGFAITLVVLLSTWWLPEQKKSLTLFTATLLGIVQGIALLPGISRLGATYVAGCWLGLPAPIILL